MTMAKTDLSGGNGIIIIEHLILQRGSLNLRMKHNVVSLLMQHTHCTQLNARECRGSVSAQGRHV